MIPLLAGLALTGCADLPALNGFSTGPIGERATPCRVAIADSAGRRDIFLDTRAAHMSVGNGGGWCGWTVHVVDQNDAEYPWDRALVARAPQHGTLRIRPDGLPVHIEYRPQPGYVGTDEFAVELAPGFALREATVEVVPATPGPLTPETAITSTHQVDAPNGADKPF